MNYSPIFTITARIERAHSAAQDWIANDAPILEARIKRTALKAFITICEMLLLAIDRVQTELDKSEEYAIQLRLAGINAKRFIIRRRIAFHSFISNHGLDTKAKQLAARSKALWVRRSAIARQIGDKLFCLN